MPVSLLYVEGDLDAQVLGPILAGSPVVRAAKASKDALAPIARREREQGHSGVCYLRDRDFDYQPPDDLAAPTVDRTHDGAPLGWRWCRHELENYLLDPETVTQATTADRDDYAQALLSAANEIRHYQAARWALGTARRSLPPTYELRTRPQESGNAELYLPPDLSEEANRAWVTAHLATFRDQVEPALEETAVVADFDSRSARLSDVLSQPAAEATRPVLVWFSGKDLLLALAGWIENCGFENPGAFRAALRDWMREHPDRVLAALPEWEGLVELLRS